MTQAMDRTTDETVNVDELIRAVHHDITTDPFPVKGLDPLSLSATRSRPRITAQWLWHDRRRLPCPEQGFRDHAEYVLTSGPPRSATSGPVHAEAEAAIHHAKHGDGIVDIALEAPGTLRQGDAHALEQGATGLAEPHDEEDANGVVRVASIATYGDTPATP